MYNNLGGGSVIGKVEENHLLGMQYGVEKEGGEGGRGEREKETRVVCYYFMTRSAPPREDDFVLVEKERGLICPLCARVFYTTNCRRTNSRWEHAPLDLLATYLGTLLAAVLGGLLNKRYVLCNKEGGGDAVSDWLNGFP